MRKSIPWASTHLALLALLSACQKSPPPAAATSAAEPSAAPAMNPAPAASVSAAEAPAAAPSSSEGRRIGMANPASKNCADKGGKLEIRDEPAGQSGVCIFADGSRCEEWAFFRGQCAPGQCKKPDGKCQ